MGQFIEQYLLCVLVESVLLQISWEGGNSTESNVKMQNWTLIPMLLEPPGCILSQNRKGNST